MTAHATIFDQSPCAVADATGISGPVNVAPEPASAALDLTGLAWARLTAFLGREGPSLVRIFSLLDLSSAETDVAALQILIEESEATVPALVIAEGLLDQIVEALASISPCFEIQRALRDGEAAIVRDLDGRVRWLGARTEDLRSLVRRAID